MTRRIGIGLLIAVLGMPLLFTSTRRPITLEFEQHYDDLVGPPDFNVYLDGVRTTWAVKPSCASDACAGDPRQQPHTCRGTLLIPRTGVQTISVSATADGEETDKASVRLR